MYIQWKIIQPLKGMKCMLQYESWKYCAKWNKWDTRLHIVCVLSHFSHVGFLATPWTVAYQTSLSMGFSRQEYWSGLPFPPPGDLPNPGIKPASLSSPILAGRFFTTSTTWESESHSVMSYSVTPVGCTVHGILKATILEWVAFPFSRGSSQLRDRTQVSCIIGRFFTSWATREAQHHPRSPTYIVWFHLYRISQKGKSIQTEISSSQGLEEGKMGNDHL